MTKEKLQRSFIRWDSLDLFENTCQPNHHRSCFRRQLVGKLAKSDIFLMLANDPKERKVSIKSSRCCEIWYSEWTSNEWCDGSFDAKTSDVTYVNSIRLNLIIWINSRKFKGFRNEALLRGEISNKKLIGNQSETKLAKCSLQTQRDHHYCFIWPNYCFAVIFIASTFVTILLVLS